MPDGYSHSVCEESVSIAESKGLVDADWYQSPVSKQDMAQLTVRSDEPAIRDTLIWFLLIGASAVSGVWLWGTWWAIIPFGLYSVLFTSSSDSRWHETLHGTAFKSDWMNNTLYEIASFMVCRESTPWRWSHMRHHSDTYIKGVDPEITLPRPPKFIDLLFTFTNIRHALSEYRNILIHSFGRLTEAERTYIPEHQHGRVFFIARVYLAIYSSVICLAILLGSILPLMFVILPTFLGQWLLPIYGLPQHILMAENTLDHRLNSRTVYMGPVLRFLYWNMNYHIEHHMYPMVPYHQLPQLHKVIKDDLPPTYSGLNEAYREIIPAFLKQRKDPTFFVDRTPDLPVPLFSDRGEKKIFTVLGHSDSKGWVPVCNENEIGEYDVIRFDHLERTFAIYQTAKDMFFATDGICTHGNAHLADGLVTDETIECPKHNGRFDIRDGSPARPPACLALTTYPVRKRGGIIELNIADLNTKTVLAPHKFKVVRNSNIATYIKELELAKVDPSDELEFQPGDYLRIQIPKCEVEFSQFDIPVEYAEQWRQLDLFRLKSRNETYSVRNYSIANDPLHANHIRLNVRIALPPIGKSFSPGVGSSFLFSLKPGDEVWSYPPTGSFHIKAGEREMVYLGGGSGLAPLHSHIIHLLESERSARKISLWYGARSLKELYYADKFRELERAYDNFSYHVALSEPLRSDNWTSHTGLIHDVLKQQHLNKHADPTAIDYYICGPSGLLKAAINMLETFEVPKDRISFDDFG